MYLRYLNEIMDAKSTRDERQDQSVLGNSRSNVNLV